MRTSSDKWVMTLREACAAPSVRLICFPYAGGVPDVFRAWSDSLCDQVELLGVRLPGRGRRVRETPYEQWEPLLDDTFAALAPWLSQPHAFYGHCFGGRLAYEMTRRAAAGHHGLTRRLFVSGCRSPDAPQHLPLLHALPDEELCEALRRTGGTPTEVLDSPRMMRMLLPVLRGDIKLAESWGNWHPEGVDVPITALCGRDDRVDDRASMRGWTAFTPRGELLELPGGHFFPETHRRELMHVVNSRLGAASG